MRVLYGGNIPERGLSVGILTKSLNDLLSHHSDQIRGSAIGWFQNKDRTHPFSFLSICDTLSIDPGTILKEINMGDTSPLLQRIKQLK